MDAVLDSTRELVILDATGDTRIIWDPDKPDEVAHAKRTFNEFKGKGYLAYSVDRKGEKGAVLREFDSNAEKMILAPATVGG